LSRYSFRGFYRDQFSTLTCGKTKKQILCDLPKQITIKYETRKKKRDEKMYILAIICVKDIIARKKL
jgi:hypothetical protein